MEEPEVTVRSMSGFVSDGFRAVATAANRKVAAENRMIATLWVKSSLLLPNVVEV